MLVVLRVVMVVSGVEGGDGGVAGGDGDGGTSDGVIGFAQTLKSDPQTGHMFSGSHQ